MTSVRLEGVEKAYGQSAVAQIDRLEIAAGEVLTLLGPSGCGKTTTLRIVAGLIKHDRGDLFFGDRNMNDVPPERRNAAMVFQNYALFPHMTVFDNVAFGLVVRKAAKEHIQKRVKAALELVQLPEMGARFPKQLSGGQQQRIAIARALATDPSVLLFDEPLSNLDAKLREYMRFELRKLLVELKITTVYVTHDQTEAMVVSDRIAVMDKGRIVQMDAPHNVYRNPKSRFVADFLGLSTFVAGKVTASDGTANRLQLVTEDGLHLEGTGSGFSAGDAALLCVRPENVLLSSAGAQPDGTRNVLGGTVVAAVDLGEFIDYHVSVGNWVLRTKCLAGANSFAPGSRVAVRLDPAGCVVVGA